MMSMAPSVSPIVQSEMAEMFKLLTDVEGCKKRFEELTALAAHADATLTEAQSYKDAAEKFHNDALATKASTEEASKKATDDAAVALAQAKTLSDQAAKDRADTAGPLADRETAVSNKEHELALREKALADSQIAVEAQAQAREAHVTQREAAAETALAEHTAKITQLKSIIGA
jgi:hypothetical protein